MLRRRCRGDDRLRSLRQPGRFDQAGEAQGFQIEHLVHFTPQAGPCVPGQLPGKQEAQMNAGKADLWMKGCGGIGAFDGAGGQIRQLLGMRRSDHPLARMSA